MLQQTIAKRIVLSLLVALFATCIPTLPVEKSAQYREVRVLVNPQNTIAEATKVDNLASKMLANEEVNVGSQPP